MMGSLAKRVALAIELGVIHDWHGVDGTGVLHICDPCRAKLDKFTAALSEAASEARLTALSEAEKVACAFCRAGLKPNENDSHRNKNGKFHYCKAAAIRALVAAPLANLGRGAANEG